MLYSPFSDSMVEWLSRDRVTVAIAANIQFESGTVYVHSGTGTLVLGGYVYYGMGRMGSVDDASETSTTSPTQVKMTLSGLDNSDISSLSGLATPLSMGQGGTGSTDLAGARVNLRVDSLVQNASQNWLYSPDRSIKLAMIDNNVWGAYSDALAKWVIPAGMVTDSNGYLKAASPVIRLKGDGSVEFNEEAEGVTAEHISTGVYRVHGVMGFNADPLWGGINGGVTVPVDINNQPLIWVDFSVENNGDILLKTYHRTHPDAPEFARNLIGLKNDEGAFTESVKDGEPVDIPDGRWVDLRIQMPEDSLWNQKQMAIREAMEKAEREREDNQQGTQS
ncbi:phage tail fiber protein [Citrobacter youngae]|uniref:phage tail fiber protein n=1 Tax=Citrobacter youngae TaxID=133448 RepID=UPI00397B852F